MAYPLQESTISMAEKVAWGAWNQKKERQRQDVSSGIRWWMHPSLQMMSASVVLEMFEVWLG